MEEGGFKHKMLRMLMMLHNFALLHFKVDYDDKKYQKGLQKFLTNLLSNSGTRQAGSPCLS